MPNKKIHRHGVKTKVVQGLGMMQGAEDCHGAIVAGVVVVGVVVLRFVGGCKNL